MHPKHSNQEIRIWIRRALNQRYGDKLVRLILAGSRAKGTNGPDSDWDILAVIEGFRSTWPVGPIRMNDKLRAPDGNPVEVFEINPADLHHQSAAGNALIRDALALDIDL